MKKTIIIFSNPFGYGPTGNAIPILYSLLEKTKNIDIVFAGSGLCMEIVSNVSVKKVYLNERNESEIENYLKTIENPYVIASQNKFCIKIAKKLSIPCSYIDVLAWFWKEIPQDHFLADEIFWIKFPNIEEKIPKEKDNIHIVSSIITTIPPTTRKINKLTIHIGGAKYPLLNEIPFSYLNLISKGLNALKTNFNNILFVAGTEAINYLKQKVTNEKILLVSLPKDKFICELEQSTHMLTTAGVSSTLESFALNVPTSFLLPLNLSQVALIDMLKEQGLNPQCLEWDNYTKVNNKLRDMTEKEALVEIDRYAKTLDYDDNLSKKFMQDFIQIAESIPENSKQKELIEYMGKSGANEIVDILAKKWAL
jgi:hypothetical protein